MNANFPPVRRLLNNIDAVGGGRLLLSVTAVLLLGSAFMGSTAPAQTVTATIPVGIGPAAIAVNPTTNKIYVANSGTDTSLGNTVTVIDGATNATTTVTVGMDPVFIAVNPATNKIYVANQGESTVTVIDGATNATTPVTVPAGPAIVAVNSVTNKIYVMNYEIVTDGGTNTGPATVTVIDGATNAATAILTSGELSDLAVNSVTNTIYASNGISSVWVIDGTTNTFAKVALDGTMDLTPYGIAVNPVTNNIYFANGQSFDNSGQGCVTVMDGLTTNTATFDDNVPQGFFTGSYGGIALDPGTNKVYISDFGGSVTVFDGGSNTSTKLTVGSGGNIAVNPATKQVYSDDSNSVAVINEINLQTSTVTDPNANGTYAIAVNSATNAVYVTNLGSNNVTVINGSTGGSPTPTPTPTPPVGGGPGGGGGPSGSARLINISTRAEVGTGANILIPGFVISGSGTETLLIRADGPALTAFGVAGALAQPSLSVFDSAGTVVASNTGWGTNTNPAQISSAAASVGAFALASGSADCAVLASLPAGAYTVQVSGVANSTGVALAEVYEVSSGGTRLANISTRALVGTGANIIIPGFVIAGSGSEQLLARGDGPALTGFGVAGALAQPSLSVFDSSGTVIASNTGWGTNTNPSQLASAAASVGAFALTSGSADSALIVNVSAGAYTMQLSGVSNSTGVALAEVYEVP
jgi:YVTN family beta-propeller protein